MKNITLLGATGSIGSSTLDVLSAHPDAFRLIGFSFYENVEKARHIIDTFSPKAVCCGSEQSAKELKASYPNISFTHGMEGLSTISTRNDIDTVVTAVTGSVGLIPTLNAIKAKKNIALANKETLVMAGKFVMAEAKKQGVSILPVDSEHSAIFQCLQQQDTTQIKKLCITASGGSFREKTREELQNVTVEEALKHPNWSMGKKITIDSSTMVNKGLEVIEAHFLFGVAYENIEVLLHPESVVHSMVTFCDGAYLAQLGASDMREPIMYALSYPKRLPMKNEKPFDLTEIATLHFKKMDEKRFPMLALAYHCGKRGGSYPAVYNAANEIAANAFLKGQITYLEIETLIEEAVHKHQEVTNLTLETLLEIDKQVRHEVSENITRRQESR